MSQLPSFMTPKPPADESLPSFMTRVGTAQPPSSPEAFTLGSPGDILLGAIEATPRFILDTKSGFLVGKDQIQSVFEDLRSYEDFAGQSPDAAAGLRRRFGEGSRGLKTRGGDVVTRDENGKVGEPSELAFESTVGKTQAEQASRRKAQFDSREESQKHWDRVMYDYGISEPGETPTLLRQVGQAVPQLVGSTVAGVAATAVGGPGAGVAAFAATSGLPVFGQVYHDSVRDLTARGIPFAQADDLANVEASVASGVTLATSWFPGLALLNKIPGSRKVIRNATVKMLGRVGLASFAEGGQEVIEGFGQELTKEMIRNDKNLTPELVRSALVNKDRAIEFVVGAITGGGLRAGVDATGVRKQVVERRTFDRMKLEYLENGIISQSEAAIIGDRPDLLAEVALRRMDNQLVELVPIKDSDEIYVKHQEDSVSWREKAALEHNPALISAYRESLAKGGKRMFIEPTRGPVLQEEYQELNDRLRGAIELIRTQVTPDDTTPDGAALTERALYLRDLNLLSARLGTEWAQPTGRALVEQGHALLRADMKLGQSKNPVDQAVSDASLGFGGILSPIDLRPITKLRFPLTEAQSHGYTQRAEKIAKSPKAQERVTKVQRRYIEKFQALRNQSRLDLNQKFVLARALDSEFVQDIDRILDNDNDNPKGARKALVTGVSESSLSLPDQAILVKAIERAMDTLESRFPEETQRGAVERIIEELSDPKYRIPDSLVQFLEDFHARLNPEGGLIPWSEQVRLSQAKIEGVIQGLLATEVKNLNLEVTKHDLAEAAKTLAPETAVEFLEQIRKTNEPAALASIGKLISTEQTRYLRKTSVARIKGALEKLKNNPQRTAVLKVLKGLDLKPASETPDTSTRKPVIYRHETSGNEKIDLQVLGDRLAKFDLDKLRTFQNQIVSLVRRGTIERGLYNKYIRYTAAQDVQDATKTISRYSKRSNLSNNLDAVSSLAKLVADPASVEGRVLQIANSNTQDPFYKIVVGDLMPGFLRSQQNVAEARRFVNRKAKDLLGIDPDTAFGDIKLARYMRETLPNGIERSEAMWAYALSTDSGRNKALFRDGIIAREKEFDVAESIGFLSPQDKQFVDETKTLFRNNPYVEKAFSNHLLLEGYEPERSDGWFTSTRDREELRLPTGLEDLSLEVRKSTSALMAREENAGQPFRLDNGYLTALYRVNDRLSAYAEMGLQTHRAEKLLTNPKFRSEFVARFGNERYKKIGEFVNNVHGMLGHEASAWDRAMTVIPLNWQLSKIALNVASALRQSFSLFTALGDNVYDPGTLAKALAEGSMFSPRLGREIRAKSGMGYMRLQAGKFTENLIQIGDRGQLGTLGLIRDKGFILQKLMDDATLRVHWRAAELMAEKRKLTGVAKQEFVARTFEQALMKNQASNSPIYQSDLELIAKRHPGVRGLLSLQKELNRQYNTIRQHVVRASQHPTKENVAQAGRALFWIIGANIAASIGVNELRKKAFGKPGSDELELAREAITSLAGQWFLVGDSIGFAFDEFNNKGRESTLGGPFLNILADSLKAGVAVATGVAAGAEDVEDRRVQSGIHRGQDKRERAFLTAFDKGMSAFTGLVGLPFWALWYQGKGLYNWTQPDLRLMTHLEAEREKLRDAGQENSFRYKDIMRAKSRINEIHRKRESGGISDTAARRAIVNELERAVR